MDRDAEPLVLCQSLILELFHRSGGIVPPFSAVGSRRYEERSIPIFSRDKALERKVSATLTRCKPNSLKPTARGL
jgi:hypothetical protein